MAKLVLKEYPLMSHDDIPVFFADESHHGVLVLTNLS